MGPTYFISISKRDISLTNLTCTCRIIPYRYVGDSDSVNDQTNINKSVKTIRSLIKKISGIKSN